MPPPFSVFHVTILRTVPHKLEAHSLLQLPPSYSSNLVYHKKAITPRCPNYLGFQFFVRAYHKVTYPKTGDFNKFPRQTHTCDLQYQSFTSPFISLSLNIRIYCSNVVTCPVLKLQSQRWEIQPH